MKLDSFLGILVTSLTVYIEVVRAANHITLKPLQDKPRNPRIGDIVLLLVPEKGIPNTDYEVFCRMVQFWYPLPLWVGLVDSGKNSTLTLDLLAVLLEELKQQLADDGLKHDAKLFLAAHGYTGHVMADYASAVPQSIEGLILLGSCLPKRHVQNFPVPVLTLVGEVDGVARITRIAHTLQSMMAQPTDFTRSPLIILNGSNHEVFVVSDLPQTLHLMDIEPEVDKTVAMETASNMTSLFIVRVLREPEPMFDVAWLKFVMAFGETYEILKPIHSVTNMTQENFKTSWVRNAQKWLSGLAGKESSFLAVEGFVTYDQESGLPPVLGEEKGVSNIMTFSDVVRHKSSVDVDDELDSISGSRPQAPDEIAARMLGPEQIQHYLKNTTISSNYTCKDLNYASYLTAYHTASDKARQRFDKRNPGILFLPDVVSDSKIVWKNTPLKIEVKGQTMHVTSTSFRTLVDDSLMNESGLFFCKLLPPDRALEWIYIDSLRRNMVADDERDSMP